MTRDDAMQDALPSPVSDASSPVIEVAVEETGNAFAVEKKLVVEDPVTDNLNNLRDFPCHEKPESYRETIERVAPHLGIHDQWFALA